MIQVATSPCTAEKPEVDYQGAALQHLLHKVIFYILSIQESGAGVTGRVRTPSTVWVDRLVVLVVPGYDSDKALAKAGATRAVKWYLITIINLFITRLSQF